MRFLLDENIHHGLIAFLSQRGHEVKVSPKGLTNGDVFTLAVSEGRILLTHDADFANKLFPVSHPGILLIKISSRHFDRLKQSMDGLLRKKRFDKDFAGMLIILWEDKTEEHPFSFSA